ncbi:hypothetical protein E2I00_002008, partial [Balaenoptera physalus]
HGAVWPLVRRAVVESGREPVRFGTPAPGEAVAGEGHNGVRSCISCLNSNMSPALGRVGRRRAPDTPHQSSLGPSGLPTGNATAADTVQGYVLGHFSPAEQELLPPLLSATDLLLDHKHERSQRPSSGP